MPFLYLALAIVCEVIGTVSLKLSDGFSRLAPSLVTGITYLTSIYLISLTLKKLDISVAYAIWSAAGITLLTVIGIFWFKEPISPAKIISLVLITAGMVGLQLSNGMH